MNDKCRNIISSTCNKILLTFKPLALLVEKYMFGRSKVSEIIAGSDRPSESQIWDLIL